MVSAWSLSFRREPHSKRLASAFATLRVRVYAVGFLLLALAMVCLLWDLGLPERALLVFLRPHATVITFGAYTLAVEIILAALLLTAHLPSAINLHGTALTAVEVLCCVGAVCVMAYTGVFLTGGAIAFWNSWALVGLFTFSALSSGVSVVLLIDWFTQGQALLLRAAKPLQKWHLACLAFETAFLALFVGAAFENPAARASVDLLLAPDMLATALVGVGGFGIVLPAALEAYSLTRIDCRTIPVSDVVCLFGGLCLRYVVITCGAL